jgi:hypothetical protein
MSNVNGKSKNGGPIAGSTPAGTVKSTIANDTGARSNTSAGLADGLASLQGFDSENFGPSYNYNVDPLTGNATERVVEAVQKTSAKKNGKSFDIC